MRSLTNIFHTTIFYRSFISKHSIENKNEKSIANKNCVFRNRVICAVVSAAIVLSACSSHQSTPTASGKGTIKDGAPSESYSVDHIPDAVPRYEPRTAAGNKSPYTVLGKTYRVLPSSDGFVQKGDASWYGTKFHGRKTSNGEIYDMYGMTAAHKTLPIPTFVRVNNLENGKSVVVRVNDRGPFHEGRVIDLTYAAAKKLGFQHKGTAAVEVIALDPNNYVSDRASSQSSSRSLSQTSSQSPVSASNVNGKQEKPAPMPAQVGGYDLPENTYLQAGAFSTENSAINLAKKLSEFTTHPILIVDSMKSAKKLFRVRIGPFKDNWELVNLQTLIKQKKLGSPYIVRD